MTDLELKKLEEDLWHSADLLRAGAHMSATSYGEPILGLIFLRYADIRYKQFKDDIAQEYNKYKGTRMEKSLKEISIEKCGFYLPECAYFDFINEAPDDANKATLVKNVMIAIENQGKEKVETANLSIEHIMPQNRNLSKNWQLMLGDKWEFVHDKYLHTLGNLTLTELGDKPFEVKKTMLVNPELPTHITILYNDVLNQDR